MSTLNESPSISFSELKDFDILQKIPSQHSLSNQSICPMQPKLKTKFNNKTQEWLAKKKSIPIVENQRFIDQFNCGYSGNIVVTGKLYVTNKRVCFYSPFNDKNIFFESTFIHIPKEQIFKIEKKHNAKIFDNSIEITKKNLKTVFFTSFVSRNHCYDLMVSNLIDEKNPENEKPTSKRKSQLDYDTEFLSSKVQLQEFQYLVNSFSCGLATKINIMGRLYITNKRMLFYSIFNEEGILQIPTEVNIKGEEILRIEKRYNTLIFDNSILVISKNGSFFFTSFLARDRVFHILLDVFVYNNDLKAKTNSLDQEEDNFYDVIDDDIVREQDFGKGIQKMNQSQFFGFIQHEKQLFGPKSPQLQKKNSILTYNQEVDNQKVSEEEFKKTFPQNDDISKQELTLRQQQIMGLINSQNKLEIIGQTIIKFPGLNALKTLRIFDSGQEFYIRNKKYPDFMNFFKQQIMNRRNFRISLWKPNILEYLNTCNVYINLANIKTCTPLEFQRDFDEIVKLEKTGIPFMPKEAKSREVQKLFLISKDKYIIESYVQSSGAPYADSFHVNTRKIVETVQEGIFELIEGSVKITVLMETVFKTKPMLMSLIESKCGEEGTRQQKSMFEAMKEYFRNLEQNKMKK